MSSKRAMKQSQKQAYAKHRSNITNSRFNTKNKNSSKKNKKNCKKKFYRIIFFHFFQQKIIQLAIMQSNLYLIKL